MLRRSIFALLLVLPALTAVTQPTLAQQLRHFNFHYTFTVKNVPSGGRMRIWIPLAHSDTFQDVKITSQGGDLALKPVHQPEYGNEVLYAETSKADKGEYQFSVDYDVVRREHVVLVNGRPLTDVRSAPAPQVSPPRELAQFLEPDRLVPVTGIPAQLAAQETKGATTPLEKAKDIYEYVFRTMKYDKSGTGWGHGDTLWACESKHGNCTDFHSVFISMARAEKIPAPFQIGFPLPADKHSAEIPGYHCWAEFYLDSTGWVPVDISEAWKHPGKARLLFRRPRRESGAVHAGTRSATRARAAGTAAELFRLSVCRDWRKRVSECFHRVLVRGCRFAANEK